MTGTDKRTVMLFSLAKRNANGMNGINRACEPSFVSGFAGWAFVTQPGAFWPNDTGYTYFLQNLQGIYMY
jgi:hypothetical protein